MLDMTNSLLIAHKELRDAFRNRWFVLYSVVFAALALALAWFALSGAGSYGLTGMGRTGAGLINLVLLIVPLMGLTLGSLSLAGERERGTLLYLLAQPLTRCEILIGKYIGLAIALCAALVLGFGLSGLLIAWHGGATQAGVYLAIVGLAFLLALVSLSLGLLISAATSTGSTAVGLALFLWLGLVFLGDLGLMGTALVLRMETGELLTMALLNPLHVFKMAAMLAIRGSLDILGPAGLYAIRLYGERLMPVLLVLLLAWTLVPLLVTSVVFRARGVL